MSNTKFHNEAEQSWRKLKADHPEVAKAIEESDEREYLGHGGWKSSLDTTPCDDLVYRAPIVEKQPLGPEDIKQGDVVRTIVSDMWFYIEPYREHVMAVSNRLIEIEYPELMRNYLIRSIGGEWRGAFK